MEFKVGDKVKYIGSFTSSLLNKTGIVTGIHDAGTYCDVTWNTNSGKFPVYASNIELIPEENEFKVGDKVRYIGNDSFNLIGKTGTVVANGIMSIASRMLPTNVPILWDNGNCPTPGVYPHNLELVSRPEPVDYLGLYNQFADMQRELMDLQQLCIQQHTKENKS